MVSHTDSVRKLIKNDSSFLVENIHTTGDIK